ncbi:TolC family protein [Marinobacterium sp. D7]|uniref:TolC family protein n=1 Tax=Marinobacterium ramblicola TaxID=2849041 RepID=UPI001C2D5773|nr:TolC family protein [Marinobacterium ramblicola]MBV1788072.1 TolC family protein [Marinobacterium ramblicola]
MLSLPTQKRQVARLLATGCLVLVPLVQAQELTLDAAVARALDADAWLVASQYNETAQRAQSDAAGRLPDPKFNMALANLPTDTFDFNQEPMTQLVVGVSQMIPRGDTLALNASRFEQQAEMQPLLREERRARVRMQVSQLWLEAWRAEQSLALINANRDLFEQLVDVATSSYVSALGRTRQQDLVRAQLELTQLDDRLNRLAQQRDTSVARLSEWLMATEAETVTAAPNLQLSAALPRIALAQGEESDGQLTANSFIDHPSVRLIERQIDLARTDVDLAKQKYKPEWGLNASYGYRGEDAMGSDRADLMTLAVSVDMPLFSSRKQDSGLSAANSRVEAVKTERLLKLRELLAGYDNARAAHRRIGERLALYSDQLLPQSHEAAEAALNAYTSDNGDFAEVVRARIAELNARLAVIELEADRQKQAAQINYLLTRTDREEK